MDENVNNQTSQNRMDDGKRQAIATAMAQIEKQYGKGSIMKLGDRSKMAVEVIPTGSIAIDIALGIGGVPRGRIVEIFGPESSGKTTVCTHITAETQKKGGVVAYVDTEHALDPIYAKKLGVDVKNLLIAQPDTGEQALEIVETLVRSGGIDLVVIDSVAALVPKAEIEGEMGDSHVGLQARLMSQALRKLTGAISRSNTCVIFTNQLREKIGIMFGNPEVTPGGRALKFYSSLRIDIRRVGQIKEGENITGGRHRVKIVKNKLAAPFRVAEFDIMYLEGISKEGSLLDVGVDFDIVKKSGSWYQYNDQKLGQGREGAKAYLKENATLAEEIDKKIREKLRMGVDEIEVGIDSETKDSDSLD